MGSTLDLISDEYIHGTAFSFFEDSKNQHRDTKQQKLTSTPPIYALLYEHEQELTPTTNSLSFPDLGNAE